MNEDLWAYAEAMSKPESELLARLNRDTHLHVMHPRMLSGHLQGAFLRTISCWIRPRRILEIGTYTGYSTLCLADGLTEGGELISVEHDPERVEFAARYIAEAGKQQQIRLITGEAGAVLKDLEGAFELCFLDADKRDYPALYPIIMALLAPGGTLVADNVLWSGKVLRPPASGDHDTRGLLEFNKMVREDPRVDNLLLPLDDGFMIVRKSTTEPT